MVVLRKSKRLFTVVLGSSLIIGCGAGTTDPGMKDGSVNQDLPPEAPKDGSRNERIRYMKGNSDPLPESRAEEGKAAIDPTVE